MILRTLFGIGTLKLEDPPPPPVIAQRPTLLSTSAKTSHRREDLLLEFEPPHKTSIAQRAGHYFLLYFLNNLQRGNLENLGNIFMLEFGTFATVLIWKKIFSNLLLVFEILVFKNLNEIGCLDFYRDLAVEEEERRRTRRNERNKEIVLLFF